MSTDFGRLIPSRLKQCTVSRVLSFNYVRYNVTKLITATYLARGGAKSNTIQSRLRARL